MLGVVKTARGKGNVEVREVAERSPGPGEVKIAVRNAGICGTDLHIYHDHFMSNPPVVMGHEFCGEVAEVGRGVTAYAPGDRVTCETAARTCGRCRFCRRGDYNLCNDRLGFGYGVDGAFTNFVIARQALLHRLPDNVDFIAGALTEPLACAVHGVIHLTRVQAGDVVVVTGPGPIGLMVAQVAKAEGGCVILLGTSRDAARLKVARNLGLAGVMNLDEEDAVSFVRELTGGFGADVVFESAGAPPGSSGGDQTAGPADSKAPVMARRMVRPTARSSRNRTSALAGCTLTSTSAPASETAIAATGKRAPGSSLA